jgi:hypothetical protein
MAATTVPVRHHAPAGQALAVEAGARPSAVPAMAAALALAELWRSRCVATPQSLADRARRMLF